MIIKKIPVNTVEQALPADPNLIHRYKLHTKIQMKGRRCQPYFAFSGLIFILITNQDVTPSSPQTLLCDATKMNGQFLGQDFNLLDMLPITAYDLTPNHFQRGLTYCIDYNI